MGAREFRRDDGIVGVGFEIEFGGKPQYSIAWPDGPATRHTQEEINRLVITTLDGKPSEASKTVEATESSRESFLELENKRLTEENQKLLEIIAKASEVTHVPKDEEISEDETAKPSPDAGQEEDVSEAEMIRGFLRLNPESTNKEVIEALAGEGVKITSSQVSRARKQIEP